MKQAIGVLILLLTAVTTESQGDSLNPSSGRQLRSGHWLTCWSGSDSRVRTDPPFNKLTDEEVVASYVPEFSGAYGFEVKDTWQEWVTHFGTSCAHCGEDCDTDSEGNRSCSCNSCSWQELETFYRPWSTQRVHWHVTWAQNPEYRQKRKNWLEEFKKNQSQEIDKANLDQLLIFDPERPLEYFLFPGEAEVVEVSGDFSPSVSIEKKRHEYSIDLSFSPHTDCDDVDVSVEAIVHTGKRKVSRTPNSMELQKIIAKTGPDGILEEQPTEFIFRDVSAQRYEGQNVFDHYKDTLVDVRLMEIDRTWWFDRWVSPNWYIADNRSILMPAQHQLDEHTPWVGEFTVPASEIFRAPLVGAEFALRSGKKYQICTSMWRKNNVYYKQKWHQRRWSEWACGVFELSKDAPDYRGVMRQMYDARSRIFPPPLLTWGWW